MPTREYRCAECGEVFEVEARRGCARTYCVPCANARRRRLTRARAAAWNRANPDRRSQITRKHYLKTREAKLKYGKAWRESNPDRVYAYSAVHRGRRKGAGRPDADTLEYAAIIRRDPCSYCGGPAGEIDHIDAVAAGGTNGWENFTACCRSCNPSKRDLPLLVFLLRRG